ncbi:hypothetical protein CYMTET_53664 [Cymbomonas tetramitiformis]|uniref:Thioesterase domain-containing protein n=1 Tax=Cymbomonas tetramitiformis TaxID=36881 RepID=A0AAE0BIA2_9CHLO|nr:hypothetical protein CYMTET_53664 [Cymbomonas tetramitiformis]
MPCLLRLCTKGLKGFRKFDEIYIFLANLPLGGYVFDALIGFFAPYSASTTPHVETLSKTACTVSIEERPWLMNPFNSVHAVALTNIGELSSGLVMMTAMQHSPVRMRGIPTKFEVEFFKKAKGKVYASSTCSLDGVYEDCTIAVNSILSNSKGVELAKMTASWNIRCNGTKQMGLESKKKG